MTKQSYYSAPILCGLATLALTGLYLYVLAGEIKAWESIKWVDVFAEGGSALLALIWLVLLLRSRPAGTVTLLLSLGLSCFVFSWWMDLIDEFIKMPPTVYWDNWLESMPIPIGLLLLTFGIYHWHKEELAISAQMVKRERVFREHRLFDALIPLGGADYLREQLKLALKDAKSSQRVLSLVAIDIDDFYKINAQYGHQEGDQALQSVTQLLLLNLRDQDLLFRLAGDRFVALLPDTREHEANHIANELQHAIASLAYKTKTHGNRIHLSATIAVEVGQNEEPNVLIKSLNSRLGLIKSQISSACC